MKFQILKLVLWPRSEGAPRVVDFFPGVVNVISGASKTGKSAVIPIIDYCLGAEKCSIPVGVIRDKCSWFGVLVSTDEGQKLFARKEPGEQQSTNEMFVLEGAAIVVPEQIETGNSTSAAVKRQLDRLAGLPQLDLEPNIGGPSFKTRPSFRDLAAFVFQPQNIVANPGVLFFKADTTEHREKLKAIFPFVLGAITPEILQRKHELDALRADVKRKEATLERMRKTSQEWLRDAQTWLLKAIELGLASPGTVPNAVENVLDALRGVLARDLPMPPTREQLGSVLQHLQILRTEEQSVSATAMMHRQRLADIKRLQESGANYGTALRLQRDRLDIAAWLRARVSEGSADALELVRHSADVLDSLCGALEFVEASAETYPIFTDALSGELVEQEQAFSSATENLRAIRTQIRELEGQSEEARRIAFDLRTTERFLGSLEQAMKLFDRSDEASPLQGELQALRERVAELAGQVAEGSVHAKVQAALDRLQGLTSGIVPKLDAEWEEAPIRLDIKELTIKVLREGRSDFLWEVGSGANWLAYHVAMTLALQQFFLRSSRHPVPSLLVYDQPSQVYFPKQEDLISQTGKVDSEDIKAVRGVFAVLGEAVIKANGALQVIVLDHAHTDVWGDLPGIHLIAEWRDSEKLVPEHWGNSAAGDSSDGGASAAT